MNAKLKMFLFKFRYVLILLIVMAALTIATPRFFSANNFLNILWSVSVVGIISMGATFVILNGKIDLSVGQIAALTGITATILVKSGTSVLVSILAAVAVGVLCGMCNGFFVACLKVPEFITTLATGSILTGIAQLVTEGKTVSVIGEKGYVFLGSGKLWGIPVPIFIFAGAFIVAWFILNKRIIILAYVLSGIASAIGGVTLTALNQQANSSTASGYELDVIAAIVIGGTSMTGGVGNVLGTLFGAVLTGIINNGLNLLSVSGEYHPVVKGIIIIVAVAFNNYSKKFMQKSKENKKTLKTA